NLSILPGTPPFVIGVISIRGEIVSVLDIKSFFDIPDSEANTRKKVIIITSDEMEFGILADSVTGEKLINMEDIQKDIPTFTGVRAEYSIGVSPDRTIILNGLKILND